MTKQTFTIPEGCKAVTVEQVGNQIITTFEPGFKKERWRAKQSKNYWMINSEFEIKKTSDTYGVFDTLQYYSGNYFQTEEQAQRASDLLKAELDKFWERELK